MLSCKEVALRADALINQDLRGWSAFQMRLHLTMCKGCAGFIAQMRTTRALIESAAVRDAGQGGSDPMDRAAIDGIFARAYPPKP